MSARAQAARGYRMRPARRSGRRGASRIHWDKVGRVALVIVLFAVLASYVGPSINFFDAWRDSKSEHVNLTQLREENLRLRKHVEDLNGPDAAEREARKLGMIDPSQAEASFVVKGLS